MKPIIAAALSHDSIWKDKEANFSKIEELFADVNADLIILPEMFATGFCMDADEIADRNSETLEWMRKFAAAKNAAVYGSASVKDGANFYNRGYFIQPDGNYVHYDKRHLFSYSGEEKIYTAGKERVVTEYKGVRFLLQICYDLRFPVFARNRNDYDVIINVANWPKARINIWESLLKARAIENQAVIIGVNRTGRDGNGLEYPASSFAFFPDGESISSVKAQITLCEIDLEKIKEFRKEFPFLADADNFELEL